MGVAANSDNPWKRIGHHPPFVLQEDKPYIDAFNSIHGHNDDRRINLHHTPVPRQGPITAQVILLLLNPSYKKDMPHGLQNKQATSLELQNIQDENSSHAGVMPDDDWWNRTFRQLMKEPEISSERVARGICSIEFFPYRSRKFYHGTIRLPSQGYTFALVRERLARGALIIVARNYPLWISAIPELANKLNETVFLMNKCRRISISRRTLPPGVFEKICEHL